MSDQIQISQQMSFLGALNAVAAPSALAEDEVQSATNIDFSAEWGAANPRRGSTLYGTTSALGTQTPVGTLVTAIARDYGLSTGVWTDSLIPWWVQTSDDGNRYEGFPVTSPVNLGAVSWVTPATTTNLIPQFSQYNGDLYMANGTNAYVHSHLDNSVFPWLLPQADTPTVTIIPQLSASAPFVGFAGTATGTATLTTGTTTYKTGTFTATEGTLSGTSTTTVLGTAAPLILATCTTGTGTRIVLLGGVINTNWENPIPFVTTPTGSAVTSGGGTYTLGGLIDPHQGWPSGDTSGVSGPYVGTATITQTLTTGKYGTDYTLLALTNQANVVTIQQDLSIGDASFTNYWHQETTSSNLGDATIDPVSAMIDSLGNQTIEVQQGAVNTQRGYLPPRLSGVGNSSVLPAFRRAAAKTTISGTPSPWAISRSSYSFVGALSSPNFTNIVAVRLIIEFSAPTTAILGGIATFGGLGYPLNDQASGISYFQTYATVQNGFVVREGAASNPTPPQICQFANAAIVTSTAVPVSRGITHRILYRTGGLLSDAYRVGSFALAGTGTMYDYALPDMTVINNPLLRRYLWSQWPDPSAGTGLPGVNAVSPPWQNRLWIGVQNQLYWSWPGVPTQIQAQSQTTVGDSGDNIAAILPGQNLVVVNQNSVYEMAGSVFEGDAQNWSLTKTGASRGCAAPRTCIQTPLGVLLFGYSGMSFYRQGFGIDQELQWVAEKIGDLWKGTAASDPASTKGRIPALNGAAIFNSVAAYKDEKVFLSVPTGTNTLADTTFVLDLAHQKVWMYQYPFKICSLFWDRVGNRLMAGTDRGTIQQVETGLFDTLTTGTSTGIGWSYTTREWSTPVDRILENLQVENVGTATWLAEVDSTNTYNLATTTQTTRGWTPVSLQGSTGANLDFVFRGTQSGTAQGVTQIQWDSINLAKRVLFFQSEPTATPSEDYVKTWLADLNVFTGTCTGSVLVDGTVVQTSTFVSSNTGGDNSERNVFEVGLPNVTYGKNISATYHSSTPFRHHATSWEIEAKPFGKLTWVVTYKKAGGVTQADMARFYAMDLEGASTNTVTNTWIIDGTVFSTNTLIFGATDVGEESGRVRNYMDWIPFPPGGRGYLFQQQMTSATPFKVWRASLDIDRIGIKGLSRVTQNGSPSPGSEAR